MEPTALNRAVERLNEYGFEVAASREPEGLDGEPVWESVLTRHDMPDWRWPRNIALLDSLTLHALRRLSWDVDDASLFLVGPRVSSRSADQFRALGIPYVDAAGNAFIRHRGVFVDVRGRSDPSGKAAGANGDADVNLFSQRRAQVLFVFVTWPWTFSAPRRTVAKIAGVSVGLVNDVVDALRAESLTERDLQPGAARREQLVDQWAAAFPSGLGAVQRARSFTAPTLDVLPVPGVDLFVSGESASPWLRPATLSLWVRNWTSKLALENRWRATGAPNVSVRETFWEDPRPYRGGLRTAPPLLVYSELMAAGDSRSREAAVRLRKETALVDVP